MIAKTLEAAVCVLGATVIILAVIVCFCALIKLAGFFLDRMDMF